MEPDTVAQVASERPKNPGRVEWGRKLGKLSKERKKLKKEIEEKAAVPIDEGSTKPYISLIVISGVLVGIGILYFYTSYCCSQSERKNVFVKDDKMEPIETEKAKIKIFSEF